MNSDYKNKLAFLEENAYTHNRSWIAQTPTFSNTVTVPGSTPQTKHAERLSPQVTPRVKKQESQCCSEAISLAGVSRLSCYLSSFETGLVPVLSLMSVLLNPF